MGAELIEGSGKLLFVPFVIFVLFILFVAKPICIFLDKVEADREFVKRTISLNPQKRVTSNLAGFEAHHRQLNRGEKIARLN